MKYLKKFESKGTHIITKVDFTGGGDGVYALYIDGYLHKYGDYYHDKIEDWITGFVEGLEWTGVNIQFKEVRCIDKKMIYNISEIASEPPKKLSEVKYK